jgi:N6-adenosine-specific RNA methylase IME4
MDLSQFDRPYRMILADPPWDYRNGGNGRARAHYDLMTIDQIASMPVAELGGRDIVLLLWATWPQVYGAMRVMDAWDYEYVTGFPWVKLKDHPVVDMFGEFIARPTWGTGAWVRGCSECVFVGRRGKVSVPVDMHWLGLLSKRMYHSRKPDNIYQYAESFPGPYLELFGREARPGWDVFGNEIPLPVEVG